MIELFKVLLVSTDFRTFIIEIFIIEVDVENIEIIFFVVIADFLNLANHFINLFIAKIINILILVFVDVLEFIFLGLMKEIRNIAILEGSHHHQHIEQLL